MAPVKDIVYQKDERVLCFHHELLYEAKVTDTRLSDSSDKKSPLQYRIHYKGWKSTWDDWVLGDRLRKFTDENLELATSLKGQMDDLRRQSAPTIPKPTSKKRPLESEHQTSARGSEDRQTTHTTTHRSTKRGRENHEIEKEETFLARPAVKIMIPDHVKSILVDDWENVTKNRSLVPLPSARPVNRILEIYSDEERMKRRPGSADADLLEEVISGLKDYFDNCLGRILLYRFEREQYLQVRKGMEKTEGDGPYAGKGIGDIYGAEHLCRLFVTLPELIAQTNMPTQAVRKLRDEIEKVTSWLGKNSARFFVNEYEVPSEEYAEAARGIDT